ncbi:ankyrin repeat domain-containing protein [Legionella waltersii]|uniref:Ankyrin repeats (3 copies) n=1 Tax=Legionella waltersii TaxID=66969 RepID=A0A0W1A0N4_9GAMM|nr:ankyrin repeat domain-containing protein [Legionella waltersii]KTD74930.1 Ankyrin repeats (3 copies) [Legionella waltersii]SNV12350.1 Uncharacterized protein conserved in bacteria, putative lipoprotein [Legionella waltersii]
MNSPSFFIFILLIIGLNTTALSNQPSFDCHKARTPTEKEICANPTLAKLDNDLATTYESLKNHPTGRLTISVNTLVADQRNWLKERDKNNCHNECLIKKYEERIALLSFPGAPKQLSTQAVKALITYFTDKTCEDITRTDINDWFITDGMSEFACKSYQVNPKIASRLFGSCYGSNKDNFTPSCDFMHQAKQIDGLQQYISLLATLYGPDTNACGTLRYGQYRAQNSALGEALYDIDVNSTNLNDSLLHHYSLTSLWNKKQYQQYRQFKQHAESGLERYYVKQFHLDANKAKFIATYHANNLAQAYVGHVSSRNSWGLQTLDAYLKNGTLPSNDDYQYEIILKLNAAPSDIQEAKPEILAYFLTIAVVNQYSIDDIKKLIDDGANLKNPKLSDTALMNAVTRPDVVKLLIDHGANVNAQNAFGKTALMYAIQYENFTTVKLLVENKADVNLATFGPMDDCEYEIQVGNRTPLMYAAWQGNNEIVNYLISKGAKIDNKDTDGHDYHFYKPSSWRKQ